MHFRQYLLWWFWSTAIVKDLKNVSFLIMMFKIIKKPLFVLYWIHFCKSFYFYHKVPQCGAKSTWSCISKRRCNRLKRKKKFSLCLFFFFFEEFYYCFIFLTWVFSQTARTTNRNTRFSNVLCPNCTEGSLCCRRRTHSCVHSPILIHSDICEQ